MKKIKKMLMAMLLLVAMVSLGACEKAVFDEQQEEKQPLTGNVIIRTSMYNIVPFETRAVQNVADFSTKLQFVLYQNGSKVKGITQKKEDGGNYGQIGLALEPGTYQLLVLAHSSTGENPSVANPEFIQFTNSDSFSDTFYYYGDIEVTSEQNTYDVTLQRATSMVRITILDEVPSNVQRFILEYQGESGVFNAVTGMGGTTNSEQIMQFSAAGKTPPFSLCAYTFLRNETGTLNMTIKACGSSPSDIIVQKELTNIPMKNHMVTEYSGYLFSTPPPANVDASFNLTAETDWEVYQQLSF